MLPDFSEYLKRPGKFDIEEKDWIANPTKHDWHARTVNESIKKYKLKSIIEIGCGTGKVAARLSELRYLYLGIDANEDCIKIAIAENPDKKFVIADIREFESTKFDLVICFSTLKHFGLHEWYDVFKKISSFGKYFIFDVPIDEQTKDDGKDFHHIWKSLKEINEDIKNAGLILLNSDDSFNPLEPVFICHEK